MNKYITLLGFIFMLCSTVESAAQEVNSLSVGSDRSVISAHGVNGEAWLPEVTIISSAKVSSQEDLYATLKPEIERQLSYLIGNIHGLEGGAALHEATISDLQALEDLESGETRYRYTAELDIVLAHQQVISAEEALSLPMILPERVDDQSLRALFDRYSRDCNPNPHKSYSSEHYWYYFRPRAFYCPLREGADGHPSLISAELSFTPRVEQLSERSPKYEAYWSDGRLVVTSVYALVGGLLGEQGEENYEMVFKELIREYGEPIKINDESVLGRSFVGLDKPVIHATFTTPRGPLEIHLFLINSLDTPSHREGDDLSSFVETYNELTRVSDLVIYNGHARYGSDNAKLDAIGQAQAQHHQLFFVNTCGSYTYGLPRVEAMYRELNQEAERPDQYLDLVLNGMPAMGHEIAYMNMRYINALVTAEESYLSILESLYPKQQMLVLSSPSAPSKADLGRAGGGEMSSLRTLEPIEPSRAQGCDAKTRHRSGLIYMIVALLLLILRVSKPNY